MKVGKRYTTADKMNAALAYLLTRSSTKVEEMTGISSRLVRYWMKTDWWPDLLAEASNFKNKELDGLWTRQIHTATEEMFKRLEQGDPYLNNGTIHYMPVKFRDLLLALGVLTDKRHALRNAMARKDEQEKSLADDVELEDVRKKLASAGLKVSNDNSDS